MPAPQIPRGVVEELPREFTRYLTELQKYIDDRTVQSVADIASANATDLTSVINLANETKAAVNELLAKLRNVGLMET